ncbi:MAG: hypothetical protein WD314_01085 [Trueperaceae bacterium]
MDISYSDGGCLLTLTRDGASETVRVTGYSYTNMGVQAEVRLLPSGMQYETRVYEHRVGSDCSQDNWVLLEASHWDGERLKYEYEWDQYGNMPGRVEMKWVEKFRGEYYEPQNLSVITIRYR